MNRRLTLREGCSQLGLADELSFGDNDEDVKEFILVEDGEDDEEIAVDIKVSAELVEEKYDNDTDGDDEA